MRSILRKSAALILALLTLLQLNFVLQAAAETIPRVPSPAISPANDIRRILSSEETEITVKDGYESYLARTYAPDVITRRVWLERLLTALGAPTQSDFTTKVYVDQDAYACRGLFITAYEDGVISEGYSMDPYAPLTRAFFAETICNALNYSPMGFPAADVSLCSPQLQTVLALGYLIPDEYDNAHPDAVITDEEAQSALSDVGMYRQLSGKKLLSFGDSIMYGTGSNDVGISDLVGKKYGMYVTDCSVPGATFTTLKGHPLIADQLIEASRNGITGDIILLNGGTNDVNRAELGELTDEINPENYSTSDFTCGMECVLGLLSRYYSDIPTLFIRCHNMDYRNDASERRYGERSIEIAQKWNMPYIDMYEDSELNCEIPAIRDRYTKYAPTGKIYDSIHPNLKAYARYYVPAVCGKISDLI